MKLDALIRLLRELHSVHGDIPVVFDYDSQHQQVIGAIHYQKSGFWDEKGGFYRGEVIQICGIGDVP